MAASRKRVEEASTNEIPPEVIGGIVMADLEQIETAAATHQDQFARERILRAVHRLREIAQGSSPNMPDVLM